MKRLLNILIFLILNFTFFSCSPLYDYETTKSELNQLSSEEIESIDARQDENDSSSLIIDSDNNEINNRIENIKSYINNGLVLSEYDFLDDRNPSTIRYKYNDYYIYFDIRNTEILNDKLLIPVSVKENETVVLSDLFEYELNESSAGVLLSFDDFYEENWTNNLYLFREKNVNVTFFCKKSYHSTAAFMEKAEADGHEIGYHTLNHKSVSDESYETFMEQITAILSFRNKGYPMTSFAFPHGTYTPETLAFANQYFKKTRTFTYHLVMYDYDEMLSNQFISSESIDDFRWEDDEEYKCQVRERFICAKFLNKVYPCTTHNIVSDNSKLKFDITVDRLNYVLELYSLLKLNSYKYKDFNSPDIILKTTK